MQARAFRQPLAFEQGWEITETCEDIFSGSKSSRPGLNLLMADARARTFECLLVWKLDRFGRSLLHCFNDIKPWGTMESVDL
jgi:DNA invertase Pin-like site-specific DNA recombinase